MGLSSSRPTPCGRSNRCPVHCRLGSRKRRSDLWLLKPTTETLMHVASLVGKEQELVSEIWMFLLDMVGLNGQLWFWDWLSCLGMDPLLHLRCARRRGLCGFTHSSPVFWEKNWVEKKRVVSLGLPVGNRFWMLSVHMCQTTAQGYNTSKSKAMLLTPPGKGGVPTLVWYMSLLKVEELKHQGLI